MSDVKRFAIMGVAGYVAPKHLQAIHDLGHLVVAAMDINDSVGILDQYFPDCQFFIQFERFERYLYKLAREEAGIDYLTICTPNYLHDAHCRFGLRMDAHVICEKPLVLNPWNLEALIEAESQSKQWIANILQLRHHPSIIALKNQINDSQSIHQVKLDYITPRGGWYGVSWKGELSKSGGISTNIGVHLFDLLLWIFGPAEEVVSVHTGFLTSHGKLRMKKADVDWRLSIDRGELSGDQTSLRRLTCDNNAIDLDRGFDDLHNKCYQDILSDEVVRPVELRSLIQLLYKIRHSEEGMIQANVKI